MKKSHLIILISLCIFFTIGNYAALKLDNTYNAYDVQDNYIRAKLLLNLIKGQNDIWMEMYPPDAINSKYPPLIIITGVAFFPILGVSEDTLAFSNIIYLYILIFSVYYTGKKLFGEETAIIAASIIGFFPGVIGHSRNFMPDFAVLALSSLSYCLYFFSENLTKKRYSFFLGVSIGLGMLAKTNYFLYLIPMAGFEILHLKGISKKMLKAKSINIIICILPTLVLALPWYISNNENLMHYIRHYTFMFSNYHMDYTIHMRFVSYFFTFPYYFQLGTGFSFFVLLAFGYYIFQLATKKKIPRGIAYILALSIFPLLFFSILEYFSNARFSLPVLAPMSILVGSLVKEFREKAGRDGRNYLFLFILLIISGICLISISYIGSIVPVRETLYDFSQKMHESGLIKPKQIDFSPEKVADILEETFPNATLDEDFEVLIVSREEASQSICFHLKTRNISCFNYLFCREHDDMPDARCDEFFFGNNLLESASNAEVIIIPVEEKEGSYVIKEKYYTNKTEELLRIIEKNKFRIRSHLNTDSIEEEILGIFKKT